MVRVQVHRNVTGNSGSAYHTKERHISSVKTFFAAGVLNYTGLRETIMILKEVQNVLYDILCEVDDVCKKEGIFYALMGGSLLGAIRHKDFIPWDDDVDIFVWYQDYPALKEALTRHLPSHLRLVEPGDLLPHFYDFVCRVEDKRYLWHEPTEEDAFYGGKQNHICVDIFVMTYSADTLKGVKLFTIPQKLIYALAMGHRYSADYEKYNKRQIAGIKIISAVGRCIPMNVLLTWQYRLYERSNSKKKKYCTLINTIPREFGLPYKTCWFDKIEEKRFRNRYFPVPVGYHEKMTLQYGDYMQPPKDRSIYIQHFKE